MRQCVPLRPRWPPVPPTSRALPPLCALPVCPPVLPFFFICCSVLALLAAPARPARALCSSSCYPDPAALHPLSRLSPLPFSFSQSSLPARLPSLSVQRCHSCVPLACSTPAPPPRPYPFPWVLPRSPPLTPSWLPGALCVCGGGGYLWSGLWPCTPHAPETLAEFLPLHLHCGARPPRPGVVNPSEHGARKLNVFNAAPSCHAESFAAMYQVGGKPAHPGCQSTGAPP